jgi:DNA-binding winged helix-turn-helix (wHTH) protein
MLSTAKTKVRFGQFEVNLHAGELKRQGRVVKLQTQPFQVLSMLLSRPGELVTREELQNLWPSGTFVEFDQAINTAIRKIRYVLGDSADNPRFIETVPRRGYRFIAPVESSVATALAAVDETHIQHKGQKLRVGLVAAGTVLLAALAAGLYSP